MENYTVGINRVFTKEVGISNWTLHFCLQRFLSCGTNIHVWPWSHAIMYITT